MAMTAKEDDEFTTFLRAKALEAKRDIKYSPKDFLSMLGSLGGYRTVATLLRHTSPSRGFTKLYEKKRLDLSVEALVIQSKWIEHFDDELIRTAKSRLTKAGFDFTKNNVHSPPPPSTAGEHPPDNLSGSHFSEHTSQPYVTKPSPTFFVGTNYSRSDVFRILDLSPIPIGGAWFTGHAEHNGNHFIFCSVGTSGRTGHDYKNHFLEDRLVWFGKGPSNLGHASTQRLINAKNRVYIFFRFADRDPFIFAGRAFSVEVYEEQPVKIVWAFEELQAVGDTITISETSPDTVTEGAEKTVLSRVYERDRGARLKCIAHWGWECVICGFDFSRTYGELGKNFIHVHHLKPLSEIREAYFLDPIADLRPVCPNCHSMLHRTVPALSVETLKQMLCQGRQAL